MGWRRFNENPYAFHEIWSTLVEGFKIVQPPNRILRIEISQGVVSVLLQIYDSPLKAFTLKS